jgi:hypothetical protein
MASGRLSDSASARACIYTTHMEWHGLDGHAMQKMAGKGTMHWIQFTGYCILEVGARLAGIPVEGAAATWRMMKTHIHGVRRIRLACRGQLSGSSFASCRVIFKTGSSSGSGILDESICQELGST